MNKQSPQIEVMVGSRAQIPRRQLDAFVVADLLADALAPSSTSAGILVRGNTVGGWSDWQGVNNGLVLTNVGFARFMDDGTVNYSPGNRGSGVGGFFVLPKARIMESILATDGTQTADNLLWQPELGTWRTVPSTGAGGRAIYNIGNETAFRAKTTTSLKANSHLRLDLAFSGQARTTALKEFRIRIGDDLSFAMRHGMPPSLERRVFSTASNAIWRPVRTLNGDVDLYGGRYRVGIRNLDGRLVWDCNDQSVWLADATAPDENGEIDQKQFNWTEAPLIITAQNARVRIETSRLDYTGTGTVTRRIPRSVNETLMAPGTTPYAGGWQRSDTEMDVSVNEGEDYIEHVTTLKASPDGYSSPFLKSVLLNYAPVWTNPVGDYVDISKAVGSASITLAAPPTQAGAQGTLEVDRKMLEGIPGGIDNIQDYCPITIRAQWRSDMGVGQGWKKLFRGYIYGQNRSSNAFNNRMVSLTLRDDIVRLSGANAVVDHKFRPLGMILMDALQESADNGGYNEDGTVNWNPERPKSRPLYSGDCVKEIIRTQLGPAAAAELNGDGDPQRFFPSTQIPLWDMSNVLGSYLPLASAFNTTLASGNIDDGIPFPPPYGDDCLSWINNFAQDDVADFFKGMVDRDGWPVLIYGRYLNYLDSAILWRVADAVGVTTHESTEGVIYTTQNLQYLDYLITEASSETRPESDINRILVWANAANAEQNPLMPALRMAEARLGAGDFNSDIYSWQRTKVIKNNLALIEGGAEILAALAIQQIAGLKKQWPSLTFRGEGGVHVGDVILPRMDAPGSDVTMGIADRIFRSTSVTHNLTFNSTASDWTTSAQMRPLARTEDIRFRRNNNLPIPASYFE